MPTVDDPLNTLSSSNPIQTMAQSTTSTDNAFDDLAASSTMTPTATLPGDTGGIPEFDTTGAGTGATDALASATGTTPPDDFGVGEFLSNIGEVGNLKGESYKDYFNPYMDEVFGAGSRALNESADRRRRQLGMEAAAGGAFGDTSYGIEGSLIERDRMQQLGDLRGKIAATGFGEAQSLQNLDLQRQLQQMGIGLQSAQTSSEIDLANQANARNWAQQLFNQGQYVNTQDQAARDREFQDFWNEQNWDAAQLDKLSNWMRGAPSGTSITTTSPGVQQSSGGGISSILGSLLGGFL